jgi:two-component system response regulator
VEKAILLVEDSEAEALQLIKVLRELRLENPVRVVPDTTAAVAYLEGRYPYADRVKYPIPVTVFLDVSAPDSDGFAFLEWIKTHEHFSDLHVFAISGLDDLKSIRRAYSLGAKSFLEKPCRTMDVENLIRSFPACWERSQRQFE